MNEDEMHDVYYHKGSQKNNTPFLLGDNGKTYFLIRCSVCHRGLCGIMSITKTRRGNNMIFVQPCPNCLKAAREGKKPEVYEMNGEYQTRERFDR